MAVWTTPRPKDDALPPRSGRLAPRRSLVWTALTQRPLVITALLLATGAIFFIFHELSSSRAHAQEIAALRNEIKLTTEERDTLRRNADLLSSGRRALLSERDDWRDKAETAKKQIAVLERELDELRKKLQAAQHSSASSKNSRSP